jgi:hypothetical protein
MALLYRDPGERPALARYEVAKAPPSHGDIMGGEERAWMGAAAISWGPNPYRTSFRALWNEQGCYIRFDADDDRPWHTLSHRDAALWNEEVVEIFLDPSGTGRDYAELEISPANIVCDLRIAEGWPSLDGDLSWDWTGAETRVMARASTDAGPVGSWVATAWLPWDGLRSLSDRASTKLPPRPRDRWRFNVFRIKRPGGPAEPEEGAIYAAWSVPDGPSFHVPAAFREFVFA